MSAPRSPKAAAFRRWPKVHCHCVRCSDYCIVKPLYQTTKQERVEMAKTYVCSDCER